MQNGKRKGNDSAATWYQNSFGSRKAMRGCSEMPVATDEKNAAEAAVR